MQHNRHRISPINDLAFKKILASERHKDIPAGFIADFFGLRVAEDDLVIESPYSIKSYLEILNGAGLLQLR
jgi:hypothetical protein